MKLKELIEKNLTLSILGIVIATAFATLEFVELTGMYSSKSTIDKDYVFKTDCEKEKHDLLNSTTTIYLLGNDTLDKFTPNDKKVLREELVKIKSNLPKDIDFSKLSNEEKLKLYYVELDRITGQREIINEIVNNGSSLKTLKDSLKEEFSKYSNLINDTK